MKILKKMIPIATIASAAMVVTPFVTSCNKTDPSIIDGSSRYIPTVAQAEYAELTDTEAEQKYIEDIAANEQVLFQDMRASLSDQVYTEIQKRTSTDVNARIKIDYSNLEVDTTNKTVSFDVNADFVTSKIDFFASPGKDTKYNISSNILISAQMSNLPVDIDYSTAKQLGFIGWYLTFTGGGINLNAIVPTVEVTVDGDLFINNLGPAGYCHFDNESKTIDLTKTDQEAKWNYLTQCVAAFLCVRGSYHFANIEHNS